MDLRSGTPFWRVIDSAPSDFYSLEGDADCEVAVLGGGITGALVAYFLTRAGISTLLLDKRDFGAGSTAASTGLLQYEVDVPLVDLIRKVGTAHAVHAYRRGLQAIDEIEAIVEDLGDDCGFARRSTLYFASSPADLPALTMEYDCRKEFGFQVSFLKRQELNPWCSIDAPGAMYSLGDGQIDPYRITRRLLERGRDQGLRAFSKTAVRAIDRKDGGIVLQTDTGRVRADAVVFASGYESHRYLSEDVGSLHTTYALATEPLASSEGWPDGCLIWETARPYFYARQTDDGRAIIGGEDTPFSDDHERQSLMEQKAAKLAARFKTLFPRIEATPAYAWAGTFGETRDGLAYIGNPSGREREYFALGYGGNGITFSMIAARVITDLFLKRPNEDAAVFRFGR
jgi:glycine/D-amino acid oxidase-like deaminating enzyme